MRGWAWGVRLFLALRMVPPPRRGGGGVFVLSGEVVEAEGRGVV